MNKFLMSMRVVLYAILVDTNVPMVKLLIFFRKKDHPPPPWNENIDCYVESAGGSATTSMRRYMAESLGCSEESIASHFHSPAVVRWALRHRIPTILIRRDAASSARSLAKRCGGHEWAHRFRYCLFWFWVRSVLNRVRVVEFEDAIKLEGFPWLAPSPES